MKKLGNLTETILVFGGPYSNLAATQALRQRARELEITADHIICTGDMVAYCGEPAETLELIRDWGIHVVMGNCEESLAFSEPDCGCGFEPDSSCSILAITWYQFADQRVTPAQRRWMAALPRSIDFTTGGKRFNVIHGSMSSINEFVFASSDQGRKLEQVREAGVDIMIGGHSGIPFGEALDDRHYWLNAGVIGMPANDGGRYGWYMLIETAQQGFEVSWHRLDYDYATSRRSTVKAGMIEYGEALGSGLWPSTDILPEPESGQTGQALELPVMAVV